MASQEIQCVWFKRDLRLLDHVPLHAAMARGSVLPLYIIEPEVIHAADFDAMHWQFIAESLRELAAGLRERGATLWVEQGSAVEVFERLRQTHKLTNIWAHEETGSAVTYRRDREVAAWARGAGVTFRETPQNGVVRGLRDRDGWARQWEQRMSQPVAALPEAITCPIQAPALPRLPSATELGLIADPAREVDLIGGESQAQQVLASFIGGRGHRYQREMSSPNSAFVSCSRLSPYLTWGCISMRRVVQAVSGAAAEGALPRMAARAFLSRCHWHCHFMQKLECEPAIEHHAFNRACDDLRSRQPPIQTSAPDRLAAWQCGRTGYPFIDACMRALRARGWINFRMRAMLVSFAAYHLWLDWRLFRDWLACQFIDYEPGIHISQIQMQSGLTGINSLRIYNPVKQGQDHDAQGAFIRHWVPELAQVSELDIHEPWKMPELIQLESHCRMGVDYPLPIVDHKEAIRYARERFSELRKRDDYWAASQSVLQRHGSRKGRASERRPKRPAAKPDAQTELDFG
jgi:deoxyribodipyrimidine photo-lyase